ncbi:MAG: hypothetical protein AcusKO_13020 [Acuticoccus sp.]
MARRIMAGAATGRARAGQACVREGQRVRRAAGWRWRPSSRRSHHRRADPELAVSSHRPRRAPSPSSTPPSSASSSIAEKIGVAAFLRVILDAALTTGIIGQAHHRFGGGIFGWVLALEQVPQTVVGWVHR